MTTEWQGEIEAVEQDIRALLADHAKEGEPVQALPDPKSWMIENVGPVPPAEEEDKKSRWLTTLGILVHYKSDIATRPAPAAPDMQAIMAGNGHPDEGPCVVCGAVFDTHAPGCVFEEPAAPDALREAVPFRVRMAEMVRRRMVECSCVACKAWADAVKAVVDAHDPDDAPRKEQAK